MGWVINPEEYWLSRGKRYLHEFSKRSFSEKQYVQKQEQILIKFLKTLNFESVLDVGCGFGRITKLILEHFHGAKIQAIDLSPDQIKHAHKYVNDPRASFFIGRIQDVAVPEGKYDLVVAVAVLMHIPFEEVGIVLKKMVKASRKHVINVDWYMAPGAVSGGYCFAHDYASLYKDAGAQFDKMIPIPRKPVYGVSFGLDSGFRIFKKKEEMQCLWHATRKKVLQ